MSAECGTELMRSFNDRNSLPFDVYSDHLLHREALHSTLKVDPVSFSTVEGSALVPVNLQCPLVPGLNFSLVVIYSYNARLALGRWYVVSLRIQICFAFLGACAVFIQVEISAVSLALCLFVCMDLRAFCLMPFQFPYSVLRLVVPYLCVSGGRGCWFLLGNMPCPRVRRW